MKILPRQNIEKIIPKYANVTISVACGNSSARGPREDRLLAKFCTRKGPKCREDMLQAKFCTPKGPNVEPEGSKMEPKGPDTEPKGRQKGANREPKGCQKGIKIYRNASTRRYPEKCRFRGSAVWSRSSCAGRK